MLKRSIRTTNSNLFMPAKEFIKELDVPASVETIRRRLRDNNISSCSFRKASIFSFKYVAKRLLFAKAHANWIKKKYRNVLWMSPKLLFFGWKSFQIFCSQAT